MKLEKISPDDQVFVKEGSIAIGSVRRVSAEHITIYIEAFGEQRIAPDEIAAAHDGKVVLALDRLPDDVRQAASHAHDAEDKTFKSRPPIE